MPKLVGIFFNEKTKEKSVQTILPNLKTYEGIHFKKCGTSSGIYKFFLNPKIN